MLEIIAAGFKAIILCSAFAISAIIVVAFVIKAPNCVKAVRSFLLFERGKRNDIGTGFCAH